MIELPHPTAMTREAGERFVRATIDRCPDPNWHFRLVVPRDWRLGPEGAEAPTVTTAPVLALFKHHEPEVDLEVVGHELQYEIDPADWLEASLEADGKALASTRHARMLAGVVGDAVATWQIEGKRFAGRFFASKWGPRLYVVCLRCEERDYPRYAEDFFTSIATFEAIDDSLGLFSERVTHVAQSIPVPWKLVLPVSWLAEPEPMRDPEVGSLQARQHPHERDLTELAGHLSLAVVARGKHKKASELGAMFIDMARERGLDVEREEFADEPTPKGFEKSWYLVTPVSHLGTEGELRCRVMLHRSAWIVAGVMGATRGADGLAWMRNKRALDIATATLEIEG